MADNTVVIDLTTGKRLAYKLREVVDQSQKYVEQGAALKAAMDQMIDGTDYSRIEAEFGLATGKGAIVYNLLSGSVAEWAADSNFVQLRAWLAGVD